MVGHHHADESSQGELEQAEVEHVEFIAAEEESGGRGRQQEEGKWKDWEDDKCIIEYFFEMIY